VDDFKSKLKKCIDYTSYVSEYKIDDKNKIPVKGKILEKPCPQIYELIMSYKNIGGQASNLYTAYDLCRKMILDKNFITLSIVSGCGSTGIREYINFLVRNNLVKTLICTAGAYEEDVMKSIYNSHFMLDNIEDDKELKEKSVNRIGNILVENKHYVNFWEDIAKKLKDNFYGDISFSNFLKEAMSGLPLTEESFIYQCYKNKIPVFLPAPTDGALGDLILFSSYYYYKTINPSISLDYMALANLMIKNQDNVSAIILGSGVSKHHSLLTAIYARGLKSAVYINTSNEYDNSDSGAPPSEAVTWGKINKDGKHVKVNTDFTIAFPLIVEALRYEFNII